MISYELEEILLRLRSALEEKNLELAMSIIDTLHPADQADVVEELAPMDQVTIITQLEPQDSADVLEEMEDEAALAVAERLSPRQLAGILDEMETDEAVDVLAELPNEQAQQTLQRMEEPEELIPLLQYPKDTAGGIMTIAVVTLRPEWTVGQTFEELRKLESKTDSSYYLYVIDESSKLVGAVGLRNLVTRNPEEPIAEVMETNLITVNLDTDQEECARTLSKYSFLVLPVVDEEGKLAGVITADDLVEVTEEEATEDMYRMVGITGEEHVFGPTRSSVKKRLPWLAINMGTLFIAILVIDIFEPVIAGLVVLAVFLPLVPGEGGNAGSQTATVIIRGMAIGEIGLQDGRRVLRKEFLVSFINGVIVGLGTGIIVYFWKLDWRIASALSLAMVFNFVLAALVGVAVPLGLKKLNFDPALASAAFVTAFTDTFGFLFFLGIASLLL